MEKNIEKKLNYLAVWQKLNGLPWKQTEIILSFLRLHPSTARNLYAGEEATVRTGHGTMDQFQIGKGVRQGCILSPCLFNFLQNMSYEMPGWMKHKLVSRLPGEISITSDMQMTPPLRQKVKKN